MLSFFLHESFGRICLWGQLVIRAQWYMSRVTAFASVIPPSCHSPPSISFQYEGCSRRRRESSLVLVVCPLFCRCQHCKGDEVLLVGGLTDEDNGRLDGHAGRAGGPVELSRFAALGGARQTCHATTQEAVIALLHHVNDRRIQSTQYDGHVSVVRLARDGAEVGVSRVRFVAPDLVGQRGGCYGRCRIPIVCQWWQQQLPEQWLFAE